MCQFLIHSACVLSCFSHVWLFAILWAVARQALLFMGVSRQEYWSGLPYHPPGDLPDPEIKLASLMSPALTGGFFQFSSVTQLCLTPWIAAHQVSVSITDSWSLLKLMSIKVVMPSNHLILCRPLLLLPSIFPSIRVFASESVLRIRWPKYWSFSFIINPPNEYSGPISFRRDWLDLFAVQGTLKNLLQHDSSKASVLWHSAFFMAQLSHPYMSTG